MIIDVQQKGHQSTIRYIYVCMYVYIYTKYLQHLSAQLIHYIPLYLSTL